MATKGIRQSSPSLCARPMRSAHYFFSLFSGFLRFHKMSGTTSPSMHKITIFLFIWNYTLLFNYKFVYLVFSILTLWLKRAFFLIVSTYEFLLYCFKMNLFENVLKLKIWGNKIKMWTVNWKRRVNEWGVLSGAPILLHLHSGVSYNSFSLQFSAL